MVLALYKKKATERGNFYCWNAENSRIECKNETSWEVRCLRCMKTPASEPSLKRLFNNRDVDLPPRQTLFLSYITAILWHKLEYLQFFFFHRHSKTTAVWLREQNPILIYLARATFQATTTLQQKLKDGEIPDDTAHC